jgi:hypothetical protein
VRTAYTDRGPIECADEPWVYRTSPAGMERPQPPREYRHTWAQVLNGLARAGFAVVHLHEHRGESRDEGPGSWAHFTSFLPPWFELWARRGA